jgi:hypothetical protein
MPAKPGVHAAAEIQADEIVGIDLEGLVEFPKPLFGAAPEVVDSAGKTVDVMNRRPSTSSVEWIVTMCG